MKYLLIVIALGLSGCASLQNAGNANYQLRQITDANGKTGFDITVKNGKEIASVKVHLQKDGEKITVDLEEMGVAAFAGQQISADALKITIKQAAEVAVAAAMAMAAPGVLPLAGAALAGGGLPAAVVGAGGALAVEHALAKPSAPVGTVAP
jgi:hypothetical protein